LHPGIRRIRLGTDLALAPKLLAQIMLAGLGDPTLTNQGNPTAQRGAVIGAVEGEQLNDSLSAILA
jgi:hypothetical protein